MMEELAEIICGACEGKCCSGYCVWAMDEMGRLHQNPTYFDLKENRTLVMLAQFNCRDGNKYNSCYYHDHGGCPEDRKPDVCKNWYCDIWDEFVLGKIRAPLVWHQAEWLTRYLLFRLNTKKE